MKKNIYLYLIVTSLFALKSCIDNKYEAPPIGAIIDGRTTCFNEVNFNKTHTINQLKSLYNGNKPKEITENIIISGDVISSDEAGNFFKKIVLQSDNGGIVINIDRSDLYNDLKIGQTVFVKCEGLWLGKNGNQIELGKRITSRGFLGRIPNVDLSLHLFREGCPVEINPKQIKITDVHDSLIFKLVSLSNVQFSQFEIGGLFAIPTGVIGGPASINRNIEDCNNNSLILRTSGYSNFSSDTIPENNGTITGILTKYNSDYQLIINNIENINFNSKRCGSIIPSTSTHTINQVKEIFSGSTFLKIEEDIIIQGLITANDKNGNFYKCIFIQDSTAGIRININKTNLSLQFPVGQKVLVRINNLFLDNISGDIQLGATYTSNNETKFGGIDEKDIGSHIFKVDNGTPISPQIVEINDITDNQIASLVQLDSVQFITEHLNETYADNTGSKNLTLENCDGDTIVVRTSSFSDFADQTTEQGNGSIVGILGIFNNIYQLYIRDKNKIELSDSRCEIITQPEESSHTIDQVKNMYSGNTFIEINEDIVIQGFVTANDRNRNLNECIFIQDNTAGIRLNINKNNLGADYPVGQKILVRINDLFLNNIKGEIQLGATNTRNNETRFGGIDVNDIGSHIFKVNNGNPISPQIVEIDDITDNQIASLVQLDSVQFITNHLNETYADNTGSKNLTLENCDGDTIVVSTSSFADFADQTTEQGNGSIIGIVGIINNTYQLYIRDKNEIELSDSRCEIITQPEESSHTVDQVKNMYSGNTFIEINEDIVIQGIVTANDRNRNLNECIFIQDNTAGIRININKNELNTDYPVGQKILIKINNLFLDNISGEIQLGATNTRNNEIRFGGIDQQDIGSHIFKIDNGTPVSPQIVEIDDIADNLISSVIKLESVQFITNHLNETYADNTGSKILTLENCDGDTIVVSTSSFADFADQTTEQENGSIVGILGIFNNTYQLYIRNKNEIELSNNRCVRGPTLIFSEYFQSTKNNRDINLPAWTNFAQEGTKLWKGRAISGLRFANITAARTQESSVISWLITPAINMDLKLNEVFSFNTKEGNDNGASLEVFISTNFEGKSDPTQANWIKLSAIIAGGTKNGFAQDYTNSGDIDLSSYTGNINIAFKYTGGDPGKTTTFRLDDIEIIGE